MMFAAVETVTKADPVWESRRHNSDVAAQATAGESVHAASPLKSSGRNGLQRTALSLHCIALLADRPSSVLMPRLIDQPIAWFGTRDSASTRGASRPDPVAAAVALFERSPCRPRRRAWPGLATPRTGPQVAPPLPSVFGGRSALPATRYPTTGHAPVRLASASRPSARARDPPRTRGAIRRRRAGIGRWEWGTGRTGPDRRGPLVAIVSGPGAPAYVSGGSGGRRFGNYVPPSAGSFRRSRLRSVR